MIPNRERLTDWKEKVGDWGRVGDWVGCLQNWVPGGVSRAGWFGQILAWEFSGLIGFDTSIAAVNVCLKRVRGLLAGLGLAISAVEDDVDWFSGSALATGNLKSLSRAFQLFERDSRSSFGLDDLWELSFLRNNAFLVLLSFSSSFSFLSTDSRDWLSFSWLVHCSTVKSTLTGWASCPSESYVSGDHFSSTFASSPRLGACLISRRTVSLFLKIVN